MVFELARPLAGVQRGCVEQSLAPDLAVADADVLAPQREHQGGDLLAARDRGVAVGLVEACRAAAWPQS